MIWNADLYQQKHAFVFQYGEDVLTLLAPEPGQRILDVGCGTGELTHKIAESGAQVTGTDFSADMITKARQTFPGLDFRVMDARQLTFDEPVDAVFTNATLHWIPEAAQVIQSVYGVLKPGGRFVGEFGGKENVGRIVDAVRQVLATAGYRKQAGRNVWFFPSVGEYATLLEQGGFRVAYASHFDRDTVLADQETGIADWIKMFAGSFFEGVPAEERAELLPKITELVRPTNFRDGHWFADYKRLRFIAEKK